MSDDNYNYLREHRPDILRDCVEVGSAVTCSDPGADRLTLGAKAEARAVSIAVKLLREREAENDAVALQRDLAVFGRAFIDKGGRRVDPRDILPAQQVSETASPVYFKEDES